MKTGPILGVILTQEYPPIIQGTTRGGQPFKYHASKWCHYSHTVRDDLQTPTHTYIYTYIYTYICIYIYHYPLLAAVKKQMMVTPLSSILPSNCLLLNLPYLSCCLNLKLCLLFSLMMSIPAHVKTLCFLVICSNGCSVSHILFTPLSVLFDL